MRGLGSFLTTRSEYTLIRQAGQYCIVGKPRTSMTPASIALQCRRRPPSIGGLFGVHLSCERSRRTGQYRKGNLNRLG
jgi:hypothetical protein